MTGDIVAGWNKLGDQARFFWMTIVSIPEAVRRYPGELLRLIAQMGLGTGALAVVGGTVAIVGFLTMTTGALVAVQGYNQLASVGVEALTGFTSAFFNVRLIVPGPPRSRCRPPSAPELPHSWAQCASTRKIDALESSESAPLPTWPRRGCCRASSW